MFNPKMVDKYVKTGIKNNWFRTNYNERNLLNFRYKTFDKTYYSNLYNETYGKYKVSILPMIRVLLRACYNFSTCKGVKFHFKPSNLKFKKRRYTIEPYKFTTKIPIPSIKKQLNYETELDIAKTFDLIENHVEISTAGKDSYKRRSVSYNDWIATALLFIYGDGRIYEKNTKITLQIPYSSSARPRSIFSFKLTLTRLLSWIDYQKLRTANIDDFNFLIYQLDKIDEIFHLFKINRMNAHRRFLFDEGYIKTIYSPFFIGETEVINVKNILDEEVFKNDIFINACLKCSYPEPLDVFISFLRNNILNYSSYLKEADLYPKMYINPKLIEKDLTLKELINITKEETLIFINKFVQIYQINACCSEEELDEEYIYWTTYFFDNQTLLKKYLKTVSKDPRSPDLEYLEYLFKRVRNKLNSKLKQDNQE